MKSILVTSLVFLNLGFSLAQTEGFYKDLFMDGGVHLTSRTTLHAADALDLDMEFLATDDTSFQRQMLIYNRYDQNGYLLYPDGAPRYKVIYTNGGSATNHGNSLGHTGRERIRAFYYNGGSYTGSCAGAFIASLSYMTSGIHTPYYHIWPGRTATTGLVETYTGHFIPENSPLLDYFDFGDDYYINNIYHNQGCYGRENINFPEGTEILLRYDYPDRSMHNQPSCWAYIENESSGRIVVIGSHPEVGTSGEELQLMAVVLLYALDGVADPKIKGTLSNGISREMTKSTNDHDPDYTKIGDLQYHHYTVEIPEDATNFNLTVSGDDTCDIYIYLKKNAFAFDGEADHQLEQSGINHIFSLPDISTGTWYIGIKCATTVEAEKQSWGYRYSGQLEVLNGIGYKITASWETPSNISMPFTSSPDKYELHQNYPNPFNPITMIGYQLMLDSAVELSIYNLLGEKITTLVNERQLAGYHQVEWNASGLASGVYLYKISTSNFVKVKKMVLTR